MYLRQIVDFFSQEIIYTDYSGVKNGRTLFWWEHWSNFIRMWTLVELYSDVNNGRTLFGCEQWSNFIRMW